MKLIITESQYNILTEQYSEDELKTKYVDSGLIPENQFNEIIDNIKKPFYVGWMLKMLSSGFIKYEDAYKFKHYFNVFEKFKQHYPIKDLGQIKTLQDVVEFEKKSKDILIKQQDNKQGDISDKKNLVSTNDIQKLESVGIKYLGMVDGLQSFQVPSKVKDSKEAWNVYREILGKCSGRDKGQIVSICTIQGFNFFQDYLNRFPGSSYYVFYNMGDSLSPYQFHYETNQFMDKNDDDISESKLFVNLSKFLLNKGSLNEEQIPLYLKPKLGLKLSDSEKNGLKEIDTFLKNYVDGSNIDLNDRKIKNTQFNSISDIKFGYFTDNLIKIHPQVYLLFESGIKYHPGFGEYSMVKLTDLLSKKYPDFNFKHFNYEVERHMNWGDPNNPMLMKYIQEKRSKDIAEKRRKDIEMFIKNNPQLVENINNSLDEKYKSENITSEVKKGVNDEYFVYYLPNDNEPFLLYAKNRKIASWNRREFGFIEKIIKDFGLGRDVFKKIFRDWISDFLKLPVNEFVITQIKK